MFIKNKSQIKSHVEDIIDKKFNYENTETEIYNKVKKFHVDTVDYIISLYDNKKTNPYETITLLDSVICICYTISEYSSSDEKKALSNLITLMKSYGYCTGGFSEFFSSNATLLTLCENFDLEDEKEILTAIIEFVRETKITYIESN